jgi:REP element-mobilizing transposase RayT
MSRPLRFELPGGIWHVTSRGNERRDIYRDDGDRLVFIGHLAEAAESARWILHAYVLMANHYHLLIETPEPTLSYGVKQLNERYAEHFNRRHERVGHLYQGRFKAILVERQSHLLEIVRYIVLNPVRCGAVRYAADWRWSNYRATAGLATPETWLEVNWTLDQFDPVNRESAREHYRQFVAAARGAEYNPWECVLSQRYLGSREFRDQAKRSALTDS